jgi:uncharacterized RDD family membrane protein YckC
LRRFAGAAVDIGVLVVSVWGLWSAISRPIPLEYRLFGASPCSGSASCLASNGRYSDGWPVVALIAIAVIYLIGVFVVQRGLTGRTIGSMLFSFSVLGADGRPLGIPRALLRSVAGAVDYLPCCVPIVGIVTIGATPLHQRVGDLAVGSLVIDTRRGFSVGGTDTSAARVIDGPGDDSIRPVDAGEQLPSQPPTAQVGAPPRPPGPLWDPTRQAYVLWDDANECWLRFDDASQQWFRIDNT